MDPSYSVFVGMKGGLKCLGRGRLSLPSERPGYTRELMAIQESLWLWLSKKNQIK